MPGTEQIAADKAGKRQFLRGAVSAIAGCVLVLAVLATGGKIRWITPTTHPSVNAAPVALPHQLSGLSDYLDAVTANATQKSTEITATAGRLERTYATTTAAYQKAYPGAGVGVRRYASPDLSLVLTVVAVRAPSSPLLAGILENPADQGLIAQPVEAVDIDGVTCLVRRYLHGPGGDLNPLNQHTDECQLSIPPAAGTVWVFAQGADSSTDQKTVVLAPRLPTTPSIPAQTETT